MYWCVLQAWVFSSVCFCKCVLSKSHFVVALFVCCQIHFDKHFFLLHNGCYCSERSSISCCGGWFGHGTFDQIANRNMENLDYSYLHCDLLNKVALTTIFLKVKSPQINMSSIYKKTCLWRSIFLTLNQSPKGDLR